MSPAKFTTPLSERMKKDVFFATSADFPQILELRLDQIVPNPHQPRKTFSADSLAELAASIERHGLIQPITVQRLDGEENRYLLVAGERRYRAFEHLGRPSIAAILTTGDAEEIGLIENIQREDLNPLEEAEAMERMLERHRYTQEQLGQIVGKSQAAISKSLSLLTLPDDLKTACRQKPNVGKWMLIEIAQIADTEAQRATWKAVESGQLPTVKAIKQARLNRAPAVPTPPDVFAVKAGRRFLKALEDLETPHPIPLDAATYQELVNLRQGIEALLERLEPGFGNPDPKL